MVTSLDLCGIFNSGVPGNTIVPSLFLPLLWPLGSLVHHIPFTKLSLLGPYCIACISVRGLKSQPKPRWNKHLYLHTRTETRGTELPQAIQLERWLILNYSDSGLKRAVIFLQFQTTLETQGNTLVCVCVCTGTKSWVVVIMCCYQFVFNPTSVKINSVLQDENVLEFCWTMMWRYLSLLNCILRNGSDATSYVLFTITEKKIS